MRDKYFLFLIDQRMAAQEYDETQHSTDSLFKSCFLRHLFFTRWKIWNDAKFLLFCLCVAGIVQVRTSA